MKAVEDLSNLWNYPFEVWLEAQADRYYDIPVETFQELANEDVAGKNYPEIRTNIFGFQVGQHIVFYRKLKSDTIEIARILHNKMDLRNRIQE